MDGWFCLHRKILENPTVCKDGEHLAVWIYLLANATYISHDMYFNGKRITLKAGQLITGRRSIADKLGVSESKVQRILKLFENEQQIEQQTTSKNRLITIKNWDKYQVNEQQNGQQVNNERTTSEQQVNTNNKDNKDNKDNNKNNISSYCGSSKKVELEADDSCVDGLQNKIKADDSCVDDLQDIIEFYNNNVGILTSYGLEVLSDYAKEMSNDLILYAMKIAVEANKRTIQYIRGILNNWEKKGIKTLIEAKQENANYIKNKQTKKENQYSSVEEDFLNG